MIHNSRFCRDGNLGVNNLYKVVPPNHYNNEHKNLTRRGNTRRKIGNNTASVKQQQQQQQSLTLSNIRYIFKLNANPTDHAAIDALRSLFLYLLLPLCNAGLDPIPVEHLHPCEPSPCGANAQCTVRNSAGACACLSEFFGNPYVGCRPECIMNSDCPLNQACTRNKCLDPCRGLCGPNAECRVTNHQPSCTCFAGYFGDPYSYCNVQRDERKNICFSLSVCPLSSSRSAKYSLLKYLLTILRFYTMSYFHI